jgi:hypothetical protein
VKRAHDPVNQRIIAHLLGDPCPCSRCTGRIRVSMRPPDEHAVICTSCGACRELARDGETVRYVCETCGTCSARTFPATEVDADLPRVHRTVPPLRIRGRVVRGLPLNIDAARDVPIMQVASSLGIQVNRYSRAICPFHDDSHPSFHINTKRNLCWCNPCGRRWSTIDLLIEMRGLTFVDAVRELAGRAA